MKTHLLAAKLREHNQYFEYADAIGMAHSARIKKTSPFTPRRTDRTPTTANTNTTANDHGNRGSQRGRGNNHAGQRGRGHGSGGNSAGEHADCGSSLPRISPPKGKDIYQYAKEYRDAKQQRIDGICSFCGYGPHNARSCYYL